MPETSVGYDVLRAEIHRKAMDEIAREMGITLVRTSGSPVVTEAKDLSCSLLDHKVEQIGFSSFVGLHIATSFLGINAVLETYSPEEIAPGDAFIVNDPHTSGALHQGDVGVIMPYFHDGELVAWGYVNEHTIDVGGSGVSGFAAGARDCYWEGLRFPALRIMQNGELSREWRLFIGNNVRASSAVLNDLRSMIAAVNTGQQRLAAAIERFGLEQHREFCEVNKSLSERIVRQRIGALPDGVYRSSDWIEYDGLGEPRLFELSCEMTVVGDGMKLGFRGVPQIEGPINGAPPSVLGAAMNTLQNILLYDVPANAGLWRPIEFDLGPTGTIVNSVPPAPVSFSHAGAGSRVDRTMRDALSQAISLSEDAEVRARVSSQPCNGHILITLAGIERSTGQSTVFFPIAQTVGIGGPAQSTSDGQDTYSATGTLGIGMAAAEIDESSAPVVTLWRRIQPSTGGAGVTQGGNGMTTAILIRGSDQMSGSGSTLGADVPPRGAGGGMPGAASKYDLLSETALSEHLSRGTLPSHETIGGSAQERPANAPLTVRESDVLHITNGGGSGLGDPLLREPDLVAQDVADGYVYAELAREVYGVVLRPGGEVDPEATQAERDGIRHARLGAEPTEELLSADRLEVGISIRLGEGRWKCGYCDSDLGAVSDNYRSACVERQRPLSDVFSRLEMQIRSLDTGPSVVLSEYFCKGCASCVRTDVGLDDSPLIGAPELEI